jgi:hypothetical protein
MPLHWYPHIVLQNPPDVHSYRSLQQYGRTLQIPTRNRDAHSRYLKQKLQEAWEEAANQEVVYHVTRKGIYLEFQGEPGFDLITKSLEDMRSKKIRLLNVREETTPKRDTTTGAEEDGKTTYATVYVEKEKIESFFNKIEKYATEIDSRSNKPKNQKLINSISEIKTAIELHSFWQDTKQLIPGREKTWCEVWLSTDNDEEIRLFEKILFDNDIRYKEGSLKFPERAVKVIEANADDLNKLLALSDAIAELRAAKSTARFWTELPNRQQAEWVKNLLSRLQIKSNITTSVCILDTGINNRHPLLRPLLKDDDCQTVILDWGSHDHDKHGTLMAGIAAYGSLEQSLESKDTIEINHSIESVKILPPPPEINSADIWGHITSQGISLAEIQEPNKYRIICMAVSAEDTRDRGRPTSWSGAIDQLCAGVENKERRIIILSAGNYKDIQLAHNYPYEQLTDSIHDPGQAWNAITVGAYTELDRIYDTDLNGYEVIAPKRGLSPFTTTSSTWDKKKWPIKPDVLMEGGNLAKDETNFVTEADELSILSTYYKPTEAYFQPFNMTSAAAAKTAWMAARIADRYPEYWPETIRGLIVHSAEWTDMLIQHFRSSVGKGGNEQLLSACGYGVPDMRRALYSASNSLTLIAQNELQPFIKTGGSNPTMKDLHLYDLPWPVEVLQELPDETEVSMRITLSYFIEPAPGEIGWKDRYRYPSHSLKFDIKSPTENRDEFLKRINLASREDGEESPGTASASDHWELGVNLRNRGSIHSDIWHGTASELANSNIIAVFPRTGWWKERAYLEKWDKHARYSLIISIRTPEETVDIYTPVANKIGISTPIEITT